jgi:hypothetical protein
MKKQIKQFVIDACRLYNMEAYYLPDGDTYVLTKKGRAVQNFNTTQFFQIPPAIRMREYQALIHSGLSHNLGESYKNQIHLPRKLGIKIT